MISLFFIGNFVEKLIGRRRFFWLYIIAGLFAGLFFVFLAYFFGNSVIGAKIFGNPLVSAVGASGAICHGVWISASSSPQTNPSHVSSAM